MSGRGGKKRLGRALPEALGIRTVPPFRLEGWLAWDSRCSREGEDPTSRKEREKWGTQVSVCLGLTFESYCDLYCTTTLTKDGGIEHLAAVLTASVMGIPPLKFTEMEPVSFAMLLRVRD